MPSTKENIQKKTESFLYIPPHVDFVLDRLTDAGHEAFAVGGCVRDFLRGVVPHDYDVTTSARPEQIHAVFADCRLIDTGRYS